MIKGKLQDVTEYKLMTVKECLDTLGWKYITNDDMYEDITCPCSNVAVECSGFFGTEHVECPTCGKSMTDLFSPIQVTSGSCTVLYASEWEMDAENRHWVAIDGSGGIKIEV